MCSVNPRWSYASSTVYVLSYIEVLLYLFCQQYSVNQFPIYDILLCSQTAILLLRIDDIVSGVKKQADVNSGGAPTGEAPPQASEGPEPWFSAILNLSHQFLILFCSIYFFIGTCQFEWSVQLALNLILSNFWAALCS